MRNRSRRLVLSSLLSLSAIAAMLVAPAATFAATPAATAPTAPATVACNEGRWPVSVQGQPVALKIGARAGDYLWHNGTGWHLRVTHPGKASLVFTGSIVSNKALTVVPFRLETGDTFALSADKLTLTYRFVNHGRIDGLDFRTACATHLRVSGSMAGAKLPTGRIWLGARGRHPLQNPFAVLRNR